MALVSQFVNAGDLRASRSAGIRDQALLFQLGRQLRDLDQQFQFNQQSNPLRLQQLEEELRNSRFTNDFNDDTRGFQFDRAEANAQLAQGQVQVQQDQIEVLGATQDNRIRESDLGLEQAEITTRTFELQLEQMEALMESAIEAQRTGNQAAVAANLDAMERLRTARTAQGGAGSAGTVTPLNDGTSVGAARQSVATVLSSGGLPPAVVAGFLGNFEVEGGYTGAVGDNGTAFGIAQWRNSRVRNFVRVIGKHPRNASASEQAQFVLHELNNPAEAGMSMAARDRIMAARTPEEAAALIDAHYERSDGKHRRRRQDAARGFFTGAADTRSTNATPARGAQPPAGRGTGGAPMSVAPQRQPAASPFRDLLRPRGPSSRAPQSDPLSDFFSITGTRRPTILQPR